MVSRAKRMHYVSENDYTSSEAEELDFHEQRKDLGPERRGRTTGKWLSRNAIMARENRRKKKLYITNLENEVAQLKSEASKFNTVIENQSLLIADLKKEIRYLKSVVANSRDISNLIKTIHHNTGMSVTSSLDQSLLNVSKPKQAIARKTAHPWDEKRYPSFPTPESDLLSNSELENGLGDELLNDVALNDLLGIDDFNSIDEEKPADHLIEHNYTSNEDNDVGVCLHVSKHRVSLEFCASCSDNAAQAWDY